MGLDLEALKKKYDPEHGWASARDEECREVLALIEELAEARLRLKPYEDARLLSESEVAARLKADLVHAHKVHAAEIRECQRIIANARASALEEAARLLEQRVILFSEIDVLMTPLEERAHFAKSIRALAQTSPLGRYVPDEVLAQVKDAMEEAVDLFEDAAIGDYAPDSFTPQPLRAALAALEDGKGKHGT